MTDACHDSRVQDMFYMELVRHGVEQELDKATSEFMCKSELA